MILDKNDKLILRLLQQDGRISNVELAGRVHLSPPAVHARVKRLEEAGYIDQYTALLNRKLLGSGSMCFINISFQLHQHDKLREAIAKIQSMPEVLECHHLTGESDYLLKVLVQDTEALEQLITKQLTPLPSVAQIHTSLVLNEIKHTTEIALD